MASHRTPALSTVNQLASAPSPKEAIAKIADGYKLGYHKAAKMAEVSARAAMTAKTELSEARRRPPRLPQPAPGRSAKGSLRSMHPVRPAA